MGRTLRLLAVPVVVVALVAGGCSSDDGAGPEATSVGTTLPGSAPDTTESPLAGPVEDACGNDLSELRSTVWGVSAADGTVEWSTPVPLAEAYQVPDPSGDVRLVLVRRPVEALVDVGSGEVVELPDAGAHEVLVDTANSPVGGSATLIVDGERQPPTIEVDGTSISTGRGRTGQDTLSLTAVDVETAAPVWTVELGPTDAIGAVSPPVLHDGTVVVVTSPPRPSCP